MKTRLDPLLAPAGHSAGLALAVLVMIGSLTVVLVADRVRRGLNENGTST